MNVPEMAASLVRRTDHLRRASEGAASAERHKEWMHFCVLGAEVDLLVNFSLMHEQGREVPRLTMLACDGEWEGDVETFAPSQVDVAGGRIDLAMGGSTLRFGEGGFDLHARCGRRPLAARLRLTPTALPAIGASVPLDGGGPMRWLVVPRMTATGEVEIAGRRHVVTAEPAYHDHNWGTFQWGGDFGWEWAIVLPRARACPWSLVFMRIFDRRRTRILSQGVLVWRQHLHARTFRDGDVAVAATGVQRRGRGIRVPRIMSLVAPGDATDLPARITVRAADGADVVECAIDPGVFAQVAVPNDASERGVTLLSEVCATATVAGTIRGEPVDFTGPALVELHHAAA